MKNKGKRYIKHVEGIPHDEFKKIGVFQSMLSKFKEHSDSKGHDINMRMVVDANGELNTIGIDDIVSTKEDFLNAFSDGRTFLAVKLLWSDGTWEYGFKMWRHADRVYSKNSKLMPLYAKVGVVNEETGEIEDVFDLERESRVPAWILQLIPMWNEKLRDAISAEDVNAVKGTGASYEDWRHVRDVMYSSYVSANAHWDTVKIGKTDKKMAIDLVFDRNKWWTPTMTTWKDKICKQEFGAIAEMLEKEAVKVFCYSYIKSLYCNHMKSVKEYKVIPLSDVLMLQKRNWDNKSGKYVAEEVWNSLDETCKGNV